MNLARVAPQAYSLYQPVVDATVSDVLSKVQVNGPLREHLGAPAVIARPTRLAAPRTTACRYPGLRRCEGAAPVVQAQVTKLDPRVRAALVAVPTFTAGLLLGPVDTGVALLLLALYGRSAMAQAQVRRAALSAQAHLALLASHALPVRAARTSAHRAHCTCCLVTCALSRWTR